MICNKNNDKAKFTTYFDEYHLFFLEQDAFLHTETPSHFASVILNTSTVDIKKNVKIITRLERTPPFSDMK